MTSLVQLSDDYVRIEKAIHFLEENVSRQPELSEVAAHIGLSQYHFQRLFTRWAGISPKRFLQFLTRENAKACLDQSSLLAASYSTGLSGPGRLHDLFIQTEAVTPGEYRSRGAGLEIDFGFHPSPFGECLLAVTTRGICFLGFLTRDRRSLLDELRSHWSNATFREHPVLTAPIAAKIFTSPTGTPLHLYLRGTNFQIKVWEALLRLPVGGVTSYQGLASMIGEPGSARAVGNAVAHNPVAYLIPCHRVLRQDGIFGEYRYGSDRKKAILVYESGRIETPF